MSRGASFFYGQLIDPVAVVVGAAAVMPPRPIPPYAAGAVIFVVAEEPIPEAKRVSPGIAAMSLMAGSAAMMTLDVGSASAETIGANRCRVA